jgi:hypothetical protein
MARGDQATHPPLSCEPAPAADGNLIAMPPTPQDAALARSRPDVIELDNMTPATIASGAGIGPELN